MVNLWRALEATPGLVTVPAVWRQRTGPDFAAACAGFLRPTARPAQSYPCDCGCSHDIIRHSAEHIVAVCRCDPWNCDDIRLTPEEATLWELSRARLGRAICRALEIEARESEVDPEGTAQIGAFSARALPVHLIIAPGSDEFHHAVAKLAARLSDGFILFAPTSRYLDGECQALLARARAGFFDLESHFTLLPSGLLHARQRAGELFARWTREPTSLEADTAQQAFAIVKALDAERPQRGASPLRVFWLYCVQGLTAEATAQRCGCSKSTILNRLKQIEQRIGMSPASLRAYSGQFEAIDDSLRDSRARRIRRRAALDQPSDDEDEGVF